MQSVRAYACFADYYDSYVGGFNSDLRLYEELCDGRANVLEVGCGSGRVLPTLLKTGARVVGVDSSERMLSIARRKFQREIAIGRLSLRRGDMRRLPQCGLFDLVLVTFYSFNYLLRRSDQRRAVRSIYESLAPGGLVCFDLFVPLTFAWPKLTGVWRRASVQSPRGTVLTWSRVEMFDQIERRVVTFDTGRRFDVMQTSRRFVSKPEMVKMLGDVGCVEVRAVDGYSLGQAAVQSAVAASSFVCVASRAQS